MSVNCFPRSNKQTAAHQAIQTILAINRTQLTIRLPIHYVNNLGYQSITSAYCTPEALGASKHTPLLVLSSNSRVFFEEAA